MKALLSVHPHARGAHVDLTVGLTDIDFKTLAAWAESLITATA